MAKKAETCNSIGQLHVYRSKRCVRNNNNTVGCNTEIKFEPLALRIQRTISMSHIVICGLPNSTIFFHIIS
jgi:hypothetical protein